MKKTFSIIIPAYNAEKFVISALECVKNQCYKEFEIILVDNGSIDSTLQIATEFAGQNQNMEINIIHVSKNIGISGARNLGIENAKYDLISFLDVDDYWTSDKLEKVHKIFENNKQIDVCCHWEKTVDIVSDRIVNCNRYPEISSIDAYYDMLMHGNKLSVSAVTMKKAAAKEVGGFDSQYVSGEEDYDFWLRLAKRGYKFYTIKEFLGEYRLHGLNMSGEQIKHNCAVESMLLNHIAEIKKDGCYDGKTICKIQKEVISRMEFVKGRAYAATNDRKNATFSYKRSITEKPFQYKAYCALALLFLGR